MFRPYGTRTIIRNFINQVINEPHFFTPKEIEKITDEIYEFYEQENRTSEERIKTLETDIFDLVRLYKYEREQINPKALKDIHRDNMCCVEWVLMGLIGKTQNIGVFISEDEIERHYNKFMFGDNLKFKDVYCPPKMPVTQTNKMPDILLTEKARKAFNLAKQKGWMKETKNGLEWIGFGDKAHKSQLAYFFGEIYGYKHSENGNDGESMPTTEIKKYFKFDTFPTLLRQGHDQKKRQPWVVEIKKFFDELNE